MINLIQLYDVNTNFFFFLFCSANDGWPEPRHRYFIPTWYPVPFGLFPDDGVYVDSLDDLYSKYAWRM